MYPQKVISRKTFLLGVLKVDDENRQDPQPDSDQLVKGMVPRIRIRMRNTLRNPGLGPCFFIV
jgi:hypothetical protein